MHSTTHPAAPAVIRSPAALRSLEAPFLPHRPISVRTAIWCFLLGVALVGPVTIVAGLLPLPATAADLGRPQRFLDYMLHPGVLFLKAVILAPLWEEIFYRGLILQLARRYLPLSAAIALPTIIFAVPHAGHGLGTAFMALIMGLVFAGLVVRTGSLYASVLCHATVNLAWLFVLGPSFGITEKIMNFAPGSRLNPLTDLFPVWWIALSLGLLVAAGGMLFSRAPARSTVA